MYEQTFSRRNPGCLVFLVDRSDSMKRPWHGSGGTLASGAARAINTVLHQLAILATKEMGALAPRHYFDIAVFGYGAMPSTGAEGVESALGGALTGRGLVPLPELATNPLAYREEPSVDRGSPGATVPVWVEPHFGHRTPMCEAFSVAGYTAHEWASAHPESFPPIVVNITDGLVTDSPFEGASLQEWATRLSTVETDDGPALLFNVFLSADPVPPVLFPTAAHGLPEPGPELFDISSPLPDAMIGNARGGGVPVSPGARGLGFNADLATLDKFLEIGTRQADIHGR